MEEMSEQGVQGITDEKLDELAKMNVDTDLRENLKIALSEAISEALGNAYDCTRVWSAWGYGTMRSEDFILVAEDVERVKELVDAVLAVIHPAVNVCKDLKSTEQTDQLRAQVAALTHDLANEREKVERLQDESARLSDSLGQINAVCIATYPECSGTALAEVVRHLKSDRDKYKANLDELRRDYRLLLEKDEDDPGNTLDTPDARLLRERDKYKAALERIKDETCCGETRKIAAEAVQSCCRASRRENFLTGRQKHGKIQENHTKGAQP